MRLGVNSTASNVEELTEKVAEYGKHLDTQRKMLKGMAKTMHTFKAEMASSVSELKQKVCLDRGDMDAIKEEHKRARDNERELVRVRNGLRSYSKSETATTIKTRRVCLNADDAMEQMHKATEDELMLTEEEARAYTMSRKVYPGRKSKTTTARVRTVLKRSRSHTLQGYKKLLIPVYFEAIGILATSSSKRCGKRKRSASADLSDQVASLLDKPMATKWLDDLAYVKSGLGISAIRMTIMRLMELVGASHRVVEPENVGETPYVDGALGHLAIVCAIVRAVFEKATCIKPPCRTSLAGGMFTEFAAEVVRLRAYMPAHNFPYRGIRLVDGADPRRSKLDVIEDTLDEEYLEKEALDLAGLDPDILASLDEVDV